MPPKKDVQFVIRLPCGPLIFPKNPVTIPSDACLIWPFNLDLGHDVRLAWATAQPLTAIDDGNVRTVFFAETEGIPAQFAFEKKGPLVEAITGRLVCGEDVNLIRDVRPGAEVAARVRLAGGRSVQIVVLDQKTSLAFWKGRFRGCDRVFLTRSGLVVDGDQLRLSSAYPDDLEVAIYPALASLECQDRNLDSTRNGIFQRFAPRTTRTAKFEAAFENVQAAGPPREIPFGKIRQPVAAAPVDSDFDKAAVWRVKIPSDIDLRNDPILRFHYVGDVARVIVDGKLITDDFYNGSVFEIGLRRHAPDILKGDLRIEILPLRKDSPIYMAESARPDFAKAASVAALQCLEIVPRYQLEFSAR
jgi:beta-galactosidase